MALRSRFAWIRNLSLPMSVFAVGAGVAIGAGVVVRNEVVDNARVRFEADALGLAHKVEERLKAYTEVLIGLRSLFNTAEAVSRDQFRQYVDGLDLRNHFPGFQVLNFVAYVPASQRTEFEARVRRQAQSPLDVYGRFAMFPAGQRDAYYPLTYMEPLDGNEQLIGEDLGAKPFALKALQGARDSGSITSSGNKIPIGGDRFDSGLAVRLPVYRAGLPLGTVEERRAAYLGSVGAGFRIAHLMGGIVPAEGAGPRLLFIDASTCSKDGPAGSRKDCKDDKKVLFDSRPNATPDGSAFFTHVHGFDFGGRRWRLDVLDDQTRYIDTLDWAMPWLVALGGIVMSGLLAGIMHSLATARRRAVAIANNMTRDLRASEHRLEEAQQLANIGSWELDSQTGVLQCSPEAARILGLGSEPADLHALLSRVPADERGTVDREIAWAVASGERCEFEHRLCLADGVERWVHAIVQRTDENGHKAVRGTVRDDTQRHKAAMRLSFEHEVGRLLFSEGDPQTVVERALNAIGTHLGWHCGALWQVGADRRARCGAVWRAGDDKVLERFLELSRSLSYRADEGSLGRAWEEGDLVWIDANATERDFTRDALAREAGLCVGVVVPLCGGVRPTALEFFSREAREPDADTLESLRAVSLQIAQYEQRKQAEVALRHMATHDPLTGLPNRAALQQTLAQAIKRSQRHHKRLAVMFVDLDRFKQINDTLGHGVGDAMIRACGQRLGAVLREGDAVARFGGDEFVLVLEDLSEACDAAVVADKVLACCAEPFDIDGRELHVSASVGVSIYPEDGRDGETLLKNADAAMYRAKEKGRSAYQFYAAQMHAQGTERLMLENGLRRAIERNELVLHYQPKMNLRTREITGVEALMRWRHPVLGLVSPTQFIPIAEETGLIDAIGRWALRTACADAQAWRENGLPDMRMSVNLSVRQLNSPSLIGDVAQILRDTKLEPGLLEIEITESAMMRNPDHACALLQQLREMGCSLAIDDFGTGYSSLSYLKRFPLTTVKIDRSFVKDVSTDPDARALADGIITLAHGLRMEVVAEGVETAEQLACLRELDCDEMQGYWLCKPIPADEAREFIARRLRNLFVSTLPAA